VKPNNPHAKPSFLRIHVQPEEAIDRFGMLDEPVVSAMCETFSRTMGWGLHYHFGSEVPGDAIWSRRTADSSSADGRMGPFGMFLLAEEESSTTVARKDAEELAQRLFEITAELHRARQAVRVRESELAVRGAPHGHREPDAATMLKRLTAAMEAAQEVLQIDAVGLYVLDEQTQFLKLRAHAGLSSERFLRAPRMLRGAKGDLEALTGHAVAIEGPEDMPYWCVPEKCAAAICVPVSTAHVPLGTLWCYSREARTFTNHQILMLEIVAGRIAVELERECLAREMHARLQEKAASPVSNAAEETTDTADRTESDPADDPALNAMAFTGEGWDFAGVAGSEKAGSLATNHVDLRYVGPQRVCFSGVQGMDKGFVGAAASHLAFGAIRSSTDHPPAIRLDHAHAVLLETSTGERLAGAICGDLDLRDGHCRFAAAGGVLGFVVRPYGWESLVLPQPWLGDGELVSPRTTHVVDLQPSDWLLFIIGNSVRHVRVQSEKSPLDGPHFAETLLRHNHLSAAEVSRSLAGLWTKQGSVWHRSPNLILVKREPVPAKMSYPTQGIDSPNLLMSAGIEPMVGLDGR
jgi:phosphoserine phosphatase RsbU/P